MSAIDSNAHTFQRSRLELYIVFWKCGHSPAQMAIASPKHDSDVSHPAAHRASRVLTMRNWNNFVL